MVRQVGLHISSTTSNYTSLILYRLTHTRSLDHFYTATPDPSKTSCQFDRVLSRAAGAATQKTGRGWEPGCLNISCVEGNF